MSKFATLMELFRKITIIATLIPNVDFKKLSQVIWSLSSRLYSVQITKLPRIQVARHAISIIYYRNLGMTYR